MNHALRNRAYLGRLEHLASEKFIYLFTYKKGTTFTRFVNTLSTVSTVSYQHQL